MDGNRSGMLHGQESGRKRSWRILDKERETMRNLSFDSC